jgi:dethiobiotin synthetase
LVTRWVFAEAVAPPVAAGRHGVELTLTGLMSAVLDGVSDDGVLLVEGVGGLLCPLTEQETVADLVELLELPTVLVARRSLGTLSQTLLAVEVALQRHLPLIGVVVSETTPVQSLAEETNVMELRSRLKVPLLAVAQHAANLETPQPELSAVDWWSLCRSSS